MVVPAVKLAVVLNVSVPCCWTRFTVNIVTLIEIFGMNAVMGTKPDVDVIK